jgi:hypothetical protein
MQVGDKIPLPQSKSYGCTIWKSTQIKKARELDQKYLFVTEVNEIYIVLSAREGNLNNGDYFLLTDITDEKTKREL